MLWFCSLRSQIGLCLIVCQTAMCSRFSFSIYKQCWCCFWLLVQSDGCFNFFFFFFSSSKNLLKQISLLGYSGVAEISSSAPADRSCGHQTRIVLARPPLKSHFSKWTSIQHVSLSLAFLAVGRFHSPTKLAVVKMLTFKIPN